MRQAPKGEDLTVRYLQDQFTKAGLKPGNTDGSYVQKVPLVGITPTPASLILTKGDQHTTLKWKDDVVAWTKHVAPTASIENSELVFVGYGVRRAGIQLGRLQGRGRQGQDARDARQRSGRSGSRQCRSPRPQDLRRQGDDLLRPLDLQVRDRRQQKGAAGVLIVHETGPAGYGFNVIQGKTGEQFDLVTPDKNMARPSIEGWITLEQAKALFSRAARISTR